MTTTTEAPRHKTTIDQHRGEHSATGLPIYCLVDVVTDYGDYSQVGWDHLDAEQREWWTTTLGEIHAARVDLSSLPEAHRGRAKDALTEESCEDLENYARTIRRVIEETRDEG
jgi:hypothetical protein